MWTIERRLYVTLTITMVFVVSLLMMSSVSAINTLGPIEVETKTMTKQFFFVNKQGEESKGNSFKANVNFSITAGIVYKVRLKIEILIPDKTMESIDSSYSDALSIYLNGYITMRRGPFGILRNDAKNYNFFDNKTIFSDNTAHDNFFMLNEKYNNYQEETLKTGDNVEFEYSANYLKNIEHWKYEIIIPCATKESDYGTFHQELYDIVLGENENFLTIVYWNMSETHEAYFLTTNNFESFDELQYFELLIPRLLTVETNMNVLFGLIGLSCVPIIYSLRKKSLKDKK